MTSATVSATQTTYTYNADGLRQTRASGGTTTSYTWDIAAGVPMLLQETAGANTTTYLYGLGLISSMENAGARTYFLKDGLGNTVALCNSSGTVTATYTYDAFGGVRSHTGTGTTEFTFTGEQNDPNGLEYLRARYYDNATGRFLGLDPRGSGYGYAGGNPVNRVDPTGLSWECPPNVYFGADICFDTDDLGTPADPACACFAYGGDPITDAYHEYMCGRVADGGNHMANAVAANAGAGEGASATAGGVASSATPGPMPVAAPTALPCGTSGVTCGCATPTVPISGIPPTPCGPSSDKTADLGIPNAIASAVGFIAGLFGCGGWSYEECVQIYENGQCNAAQDAQAAAYITHNPDEIMYANELYAASCR